MQKKIKSFLKHIRSRKVFKVIIFILILATIFFVSIFSYRYIKQQTLDRVQSTIIPTSIKKILTNPESKIRSIENLQEVSGVYQFILKLETNDKKSTYVLYMSKDGKIIFTSGIKVDDIKNTQETATTSASPVIKDETK